MRIQDSILYFCVQSMSFKFGKLALYLELIVKVKSSLFFVNRPVNKLRVYQPFDSRAGLDRRHDALFRL